MVLGYPRAQRTQIADLLVSFTVKSLFLALLIRLGAAPAGEIVEVWEHNLTFSQAPTAESEAAWASVIPVGRGFIHHDEIAPFISNIAAFHQLHCLVSFCIFIHVMRCKDS
jgi:hypothetical protein